MICVAMKHDGSVQPASTLHKRTIEKEDFKEYYHHMGLCFVPMRQAMDIRPYNVVDALFNDDKAIEKEFKGWYENKEHSFMYFNNNNQWVGCGLLNGSDMDDIFVLEYHQKHGYGSQIVRDLLNHAQKNNIQLYTGSVVYNKHAGQLYEDHGFVPYKEVTYYRWLNND